jgi:transmembrane sensor
MNLSSIDPRDPQTAEQWFAARRSRHDAELERRFSGWLAENTANFEAYALCELTWELCGTAAAGMSTSTTATRWYRRPVVCAAAAVLLAALGLFTFVRLNQPVTTVWITGPGEQLPLMLEDGSHVTLNTRSRLAVRMSASRRSVQLLEGEAFFDVAHDARRPFDIDTRLGSVIAVGTRFDLLLQERSLEVNMQEGKVLVRSAAAGAPQSLAVAGEKATLTAGSARARLETADLNRIENWRNRRIEFDRVQLAEALKEFSRYTPLPIRAGSPEIGAIAISAVLKTGDVQALRATLLGAFGLSVVEQKGEFVVVDRR